MLTINDIKLYEFNPKIHNDTQLEQLAKIVKKIGWRSNVLVNHETGKIIVGHGRFLAWQKFKDEMGLDDIWITDDTGNTIFGAISKKKMSENDEKMYRIADNKVAEMGELDIEIVKHEILDFDDEYIDLTGFRELDLDLDYSKKNKEVDPNGLKNDTTLKITFTNYEKYLKCLELLNNIREETEQSDDEILFDLLTK